MIKLAKLNEKHLTELTQVIYYGDMENNPDWKLLELNGALQSAIEEGQVLAFKGIDHIQLWQFMSELIEKFENKLKNARFFPSSNSHRWLK